MSKQRRFHYWVKCSKCGRSMVKDRSLADCWLIIFYGNKECEHDFVKVKKTEAMMKI